MTDTSTPTPAKIFRVSVIFGTEWGAAIEHCKALLQEQGGLILDFHMFSNLALALQVEISGRGLVAFIERVRAENCAVEFKPDVDALAAAGAEVLSGTVQLVFAHEDGSMKIPVPAVPG